LAVLAVYDVACPASAATMLATVFSRAGEGEKQLYGPSSAVEADRPFSGWELYFSRSNLPLRFTMFL
jgi:hypothetical protein